MIGAGIFWAIALSASSLSDIVAHNSQRLRATILAMVPDLTGSVDIKLNRRVSLQRGGGQIGWRLPDIALSGSTPAKPSGDSWRLCSKA
jgi:hypothetical protein